MAHQKTLLLVDDEPLNLNILNDFLRRDYHTRIATDGPQAIRLAHLNPLPDLILLDVNMPGMDGYEVCSRLKNDRITAHIPLIFLSALDKTEEITRGLNLGAVDYIAKPVIPSIVTARVRTHLRLNEARELLENHNQNLESLVTERTRALQEQTDEIMQIQELTIVALGSLAETRDNETGNHIFRTQAYVKALAEELSTTRYGQKNGTADDWPLIWKSAPLHDIGKVGIPDAILLKPARLTQAEFAIMQQHTELGRKALSIAESRVSLHKSYLRVAIDIAYSHHERWDGAGYPEGIGRESIPVSARLMAVADVYDALISMRVYKAPISHEDAIAIIREERGRQFDPDVVDCFLGLADDVRMVALQFDDAE